MSSIFRNKKKKVGATGVPEVSRVPSGEVMDRKLWTITLIQRPPYDSICY